MTLTRKELRSRRIENGLCGDCGNPARTKQGRSDITLSRCQRCHDRTQSRGKQQRKQRQYYDRKQRGVCVDCGDAVLVLSNGTVRTRCKRHLEMCRRLWAEWRAREKAKASSDSSVR